MPTVVVAGHRQYEGVTNIVLDHHEAALACAATPRTTWTPKYRLLERTPGRIPFLRETRGWNLAFLAPQFLLPARQWDVQPEDKNCASNRSIPFSIVSNNLGNLLFVQSNPNGLNPAHSGTVCAWSLFPSRGAHCDGAARWGPSESRAGKSLDQRYPNA